MSNTVSQLPLDDPPINRTGPNPAFNGTPSGSDPVTGVSAKRTAISPLIRNSDRTNDDVNIGSRVRTLEENLEKLYGELKNRFSELYAETDGIRKDISDITETVNIGNTIQSPHSLTNTTWQRKGAKFISMNKYSNNSYVDNIKHIVNEAIREHDSRDHNFIIYGLEAFYSDNVMQKDHDARMVQNILSYLGYNSSSVVGIYRLSKEKIQWITNILQLR